MTKLDYYVFVLKFYILTLKHNFPQILIIFYYSKDNNTTSPGLIYLQRNKMTKNDATKLDYYVFVLKFYILTLKHNIPQILVIIFCIILKIITKPAQD